MNAEFVCYAVASTLFVIGVLIVLIVDVIKERKKK